MERIRLSPNINVKVMPRLETLYYFIYELAESFGAEDSVLKAIETGIFHNQILRQISIQYKNKEGLIVGKIIIQIDWEKHFCLASTENGKSFEIDMSKSVVDNIVSWKKYIVQHTQEIIKQFNVVKIDARYHYRKEIEQDKEQYDKALKIMGHIIAPAHSENIDIDMELEKKLREIFEKNKDFEEQKTQNTSIDKISPSCKPFDELTLDIYSRKKNT